jgi:hypothetical protein
MAETFYYPWQVQEAERQRLRTARATRRTARKKKQLVIKGVTKVGPMYTIAVDIAVMPAAGKMPSYSSTLTTDKPSTYYLVRAQITQHVGTPQIQGFMIAWSLPSGWYWADGLSTYSYEESVSNPLPVIRKVKSPLVMNQVQFTATVADYFV